METDTIFSDTKDNTLVPEQECTYAPSLSMDNTLLESTAHLYYMSHKTGEVFVN